MKELTLDSPFSKEMFEVVDMRCPDGDKQIALHTNLGSFTVLVRLTGSGWVVSNILCFKVHAYTLQALPSI